MFYISAMYVIFMSSLWLYATIYQIKLHNNNVIIIKNNIVLKLNINGIHYLLFRLLYLNK